MAISPYLKNRRLLNAWQRVMQEQIGPFNQIAGRGSPLNRNCEIYLQQDRDAIAASLDSAYDMVADLLNFVPIPEWFVNTIPLGRGIPTRNEYFQTENVANGGSWKLQAFGQRGTTLIEAAATVVYSDVGGYGVFNTATITVPAGSLTNTDEIQIFFTTTDGATAAADEAWQIEPTTTTLVGANFVIAANRSLFVKPSIWATPYVVTDPNNQEPNAADNASLSPDFVTTVDVYRVYNDDTTQIEVLDWNNAVIGTYDGVITDSNLGLFTFHNDCWGEILSCCCNRPVRLRVHYQAGQPLVKGRMQNRLETAIIRLANVLQPVELCPMCSATKNMWEQDRNPAVKDRIAIITSNAAQNAWGLVTYGSVYAYQVAVDMRIVSGGSMMMHLR